MDSKRPQGIVILTKTPIQDRLREPMTALGGLKNAGFVERLMAELAGHRLIQWFLSDDTHGATSSDKDRNSNHLSSNVKLFVCHQLNYTSCYEIRDWMQALPDYEMRFQNPSIPGVSRTSDVNYADEYIPRELKQRLVAQYRQPIPRFTDNDVFCRIREDYFLPNDAYFTLSSGQVGQGLLSRFFTYMKTRGLTRFIPMERFGRHCNNVNTSYGTPRIKCVTMQGRRDFSRLLEVAIRAAFVQGCRSVVVINPHALDLQRDCVEDALWTLSAQRPFIKNQVCLGRSKQGGCYLLGVAYQRKTVLNLRRLTTGVEWCSKEAYNQLCTNVSKLGWNAATLRASAEELIDVDNIDLVPRHVGFPLEHLLDETVSVVVPTRDCEDYINETLDSIVQNASRKRPLQVIVVDANSEDDTLAKVRSFQRNLRHHIRATGPITPSRLSEDVSLVQRRQDLSIATNTNNTIDEDSTLNGTHSNNYFSSSSHHHSNVEWAVSVEMRKLPVDAPTHRGELINYAVRHFVKGSFFVIVHPGTSLPLYWDTTALRCLNRPGVVMGAFSYHLFLRDKYIERKNISWALRCYIMDFLINYRSVKYELPLGDQAFFMFTYYYHLMGGYPRHVIMDDVTMVEQAHRCGHVGISHSPVTVWPMRALTHGFLRTALLDSLLLWAYKLGAPPEQLAPFYNKMAVVNPDYLDGY